METITHFRRRTNITISPSALLVPSRLWRGQHRWAADQERLPDQPGKSRHPFLTMATKNTMATKLFQRNFVTFVTFVFIVTS
jgi:hypothetical protein